MVLFAAVVVELPHPGRVLFEGFGGGEANRIVLAPETSCASEGGDACECAIKSNSDSASLTHADMHTGRR